MVVDYFLDKKQSEWQEKRGVVVWVMSSPIAVSSKLRKREIGANYKINKNGRGRGKSSERRGGVRRLRRLVSLFCSASPVSYLAERTLPNRSFQTTRKSLTNTSSPLPISTMSSYLKSVREWATPTLKSSAFLSRGVLTPEEFVAAGDELVYKCPTWSWEGGDPTKAKSYLPLDKQVG